MKSIQAEESRIRYVYERRSAMDGRYSWFDNGHLFTIQQLERRLLRLLRRRGIVLAKTDILELGCGNGYWLRDFVKWGASPEKLSGVDLLGDRVAQAKSLCPPKVQLLQANAADLPFRDQSFDLVFQATVFTSVLDIDVKKKAAAEMLRVLKGDGLILWYDFHCDNPRNRDVRGIRRGEIANELFPRCKVELEAATLAPPIARWLAPYSWAACYLLEKIPWFCTHYLGTIQRPAHSGWIAMREPQHLRIID